MANRSVHLLFTIILYLLCYSLFAEGPFDFSRLSKTGAFQQRFIKLAHELSMKVNLFSDAWKLDANAEFIGGTTRDYLYWLKGKLAKAKSAQDLERIIQSLRALKRIDIRDFIIGESDVDIISKHAYQLNASDYGVKKIDRIDGERFDLSTEKGKSELKQGYIPVEKIRLGKEGFVMDSGFGDGIAEVLAGKPTVHFSSDEEFAKTHFARQKINHPILLVIRYLRILAMDYFYTHGDGFPDLDILLNIDPAIEEEIRRVVETCMNGKELLPYLNEDSGRFETWINMIIKKAFRSWTNPTATNELFRHFRIHDIIGIYEKMKPVNQFLFVKHRNWTKIRAAFKKIKMTPSHLFEPVTSHFPDLKFYHGTKSEGAFRAILMQGIKPSIASQVMAGAGLYGVGKGDIDFAETWGGSRDRVVVFEMSEKARLVDISREGPAKALFEKLNLSHDEFADRFGIDVLKYDYGRQQAYVVKNSAVLGKPRGLTREILSLSKAIKRASKVRSFDDIRRFIDSVQLNQFSRIETDIIFSELFEQIEKRAKKKNPALSDAELKGLSRGLIGKIFEVLDYKIVKAANGNVADPYALKKMMIDNFDYKKMIPPQYRPSRQHMLLEYVRMIESTNPGLSLAGSVFASTLANGYMLESEKMSAKFVFDYLSEQIKNPDPQTFLNTALAIHTIRKNVRESHYHYSELKTLLEAGALPEINSEILLKLVPLLETGNSVVRGHVEEIFKGVVPEDNRELLRALLDIFINHKALHKEVAGILVHIGRFYEDVAFQLQTYLKHKDKVLVNNVAAFLNNKKLKITGRTIRELNRMLMGRNPAAASTSAYILKSLGMNPKITQKTARLIMASIRKNSERFNIMAQALILEYPEKFKAHFNQILKLMLEGKRMTYHPERIVTVLAAMNPPKSGRTVSLIIKALKQDAWKYSDLLPVLATMPKQSRRHLPFLETLCDVYGRSSQGRQEVRLRKVAHAAAVLQIIDPGNETARPYLKSFVKEFNLQSISWFMNAAPAYLKTGFMRDEALARLHSFLTTRSIHYRVPVIDVLLRYEPNHPFAVNAILEYLKDPPAGYLGCHDMAELIIKHDVRHPRLIEALEEQVRGSFGSISTAITLLRYDPNNPIATNKILESLYPERREDMKKYFDRVRSIFFRLQRYGCMNYTIRKGIETRVDDPIVRPIVDYVVSRIEKQEPRIFEGRSRASIKGKTYTVTDSGLDGETLFDRKSGRNFRLQSWRNLRKYSIITGYLSMARVSFKRIHKRGPGYVMYELVSGLNGQELLTYEASGNMKKLKGVGINRFYIILERLMKAGLVTSLKNIVWNGRKWMIRDPYDVNNIGYAGATKHYGKYLKRRALRRSPKDCAIIDDIILLLQ